MNITIETKMSDVEIGAASASLMRFERMRSVPAVVLLGAVTLLGLGVLPVTVTVPFGLGFLVMGSLSLTWISRARKVAAPAARFAMPYKVAISDKSITATQEDAVTTLPWDDLRHVTRTAQTWIFVPREAEKALMLPIRSVTAAEAEQLTALLSAWPARKYRRSTV
ncbi:YcxB family protein [Actinacidiphila yeochonensis]|uniref:YcxB family protein n=1 Tax=Actinacidiphila yeochonensis TaxID=89050 RepID=UPI0012FEDABB|nr:YcxB family protein [Actinacidiphila yeochonensis]